MKEIRQYKQYFEEEASILRPKDHWYRLDLEFDFDRNKGQLVIPDCGGMMDMVPKSYKQEAWVKSLMEGLKHKQVWATVWELLNQEAYDAVLRALDEFGAQLKKQDTKIR